MPATYVEGDKVSVGGLVRKTWINKHTNKEATQQEATHQVGTKRVIDESRDKPNSTIRYYKDEPVYGIDTANYAEVDLYQTYVWSNGAWQKGEISKNLQNTGKQGERGHYNSLTDIPEHQDVQGTDWGAAGVSKDDFVDDKGNPLTLVQIAANLDPKLPNLTGKPLLDAINDLAPKYQGVPEEERESAKKAMKEDVYGISKEARKVGAQMRGAYGGMGAGMRAGIEQAGDVGQAFGKAQRGYKEDIYGLEKAAGREFEGEMEGFLDTSWFTTPEGGASTTNWESEFGLGAEPTFGDDETETTDFREGGYVPKNKRFNSETFLDVLSNLPDAGGS
jgi:hypothetical protein